MTTPATERIGKYEVGRALGTGAYSSVREATHLETGKKYAMKILDKTQLQKEDMGPQLNREIAVMLKMSHRNVCTMCECFQTADKVYLVLELVAGGDLFEKIEQQKKLDEDTARNFFQQLILGLNYCHKRGVAHRDLKPENLLLDENNVLKLSDFGFANTQATDNDGKVDPSMLLQTVCGTPSYAAPEVLMGSGYNGFQADMWSSGVILYVMLSGSLPFYDKNMGKMMQKITTGQYKDQEYFSEGAKNLIAKLLCVNPEQRYTAEDCMKDPWFRVGWNDEWLLDPPAEAKPAAKPKSAASASTAATSPTAAAGKASPTAASSSAAVAKKPAAKTAATPTATTPTARAHASSVGAAKKPPAKK